MIAFINDAEEFDRQIRPVVRRVPLAALPGRRSLPELGAVEKSVITAFIASLLLPGSGHIMRGHYFIGLLFLAGAAFAWLPPVSAAWPLLLIHLSAAFNLLSYGFNEGDCRNS